MNQLVLVLIALAIFNAIMARSILRQAPDPRSNNLESLREGWTLEREYPGDYRHSAHVERDQRIFEAMRSVVLSSSRVIQVQNKITDGMGLLLIPMIVVLVVLSASMAIGWSQTNNDPNFMPWRYLLVLFVSSGIFTLLSVAATKRFSQRLVNAQTEFVRVLETGSSFENESVQRLAQNLRKQSLRAVFSAPLGLAIFLSVLVCAVVFGIAVAHPIARYQTPFYWPFFLVPSAVAAPWLGVFYIAAFSERVRSLARLMRSTGPRVRVIEEEEEEEEPETADSKTKRSQ